MARRPGRAAVRAGGGRRRRCLRRDLEDPEEDEAELAWLIVDPARRGAGLGRALARALTAEARRLGWSDVWLRVHPGNEPALRAYAAAGFERATPEDEIAFNLGQPVAFVWMRAPA